MAGYIGTKAALLSTTTASVGGDSTVGGDLTVDTNTLYVDSANNRVGIGNTSPTQALDVTGDIITSGGVYLGGTGSANYLDDYEEGTWTPTVVSGTLTNLAQATYTKIGNVVHCQMKVNNFSDTSSSAVVEINLPFAAFSNDRSVIATSVLSANVSGLNDMNCYMDAGNVIRFYSSVTGGSYDSLLHSDLTSSSTMYVGFSYFSS